MAYDTKLENRIDSLTADWELTKKQIFGGLCYFLNGNMALGIHKDELIVKANEDQGKELLKQLGMRPFDMSKRPMKNWFMAGGVAIKDDKKLLELLEISRDFTSTLPPK